MSRLLLSLLVLALPSITMGAEPVPAKPVTVPFELLPSRHMTVQILVNGKGPYRVLFDTGAPQIMLGSRLAEECGLVGRGVLTTAPLASSQANVRTLEISGATASVRAENVPVLLTDHPQLKAAGRAQGAPEGIVGFPFFARFALIIDYQARTLTFTPNGYQPPDVLRGMLVAVTAPLSTTAPVLAPAGQWGLIVTKPAGDDSAGVTVRGVFPDSAAAAAGLRVGDRLLTIDGRWTDSVADTAAAAGLSQTGRAVPIEVSRTGRTLKFSVTPRRGW